MTLEVQDLHRIAQAHSAFTKIQEGIRLLKQLQFDAYTELGIYYTILEVDPIVKALSKHLTGKHTP